MSKILVISEGDYSSDIHDVAELIKQWKLDADLVEVLEERPVDKSEKLTYSIFAKAAKSADSFDEIAEHMDSGEYDLFLFLGKNNFKYHSGKELSECRHQIIESSGVKMIGLDSLRYFMMKREKLKHPDIVATMSKVVGELKGFSSKPQTNYKLIEDMDSFYDVVDYIVEARLCCFDFETTSLEWYDENVLPTMLSLSFQHGFSYVIPLYHKEPILNEKGKLEGYKEDSQVFDEDEIQEIFQVLKEDIFENKKVRKIAHNLKYDLHWMMRYGVYFIDGRFDDTMVMSHILDELSPNGLKDLAKTFYPHYAGYDSEVGKFSWDAVPRKILAKYAAIDTDMTLKLQAIMEDLLVYDRFDQRRLKKIGNGDSIWEIEKMEHRLYIYYRNLVMPSMIALHYAEHDGAYIDKQLIKNSIKHAKKLLEKKRKDLLSYREVKKFQKRVRENMEDKELEAIEAKIEARKKKVKEEKHETDRYLKNWRNKIKEIKANGVDYEINFSSPSQLSNLLYEDYGFGFPEFKDKKGNKIRTTARDVISEIDNPFIVTLFAYRSISKMISTYYVGILDRLDKNNKLHTNFLLHGTVTGRLSSRNPNFQNIPSRIKFKDEDAEECLKMVKKFFCTPSEDHYVVQVDYSQAELRVIANLSGDPEFIHAYQNSIDIHALTAANTVGVSLEEFYKMDKDEQKDYRWGAKGTNFGLVYDISVKGYQAYLKTQYGIVISEKEAQRQYDVYFKKYNKLKDWHHNYISFAKKTGYVRTLFGRKRHLPNINAMSDKGLMAADERYAINSPVQGTSGEFTIFSAAVLRHRLPKEIKFFNTIHDSLFFYIPKSMFKYGMGIIKETCENAPIKLYFNINPGLIPMKIDVEISDKNWGEQEEVDLSEIL